MNSKETILHHVHCSEVLQYVHVGFLAFTLGASRLENWIRGITNWMFGKAFFAIASNC